MNGPSGCSSLRILRGATKRTSTQGVSLSNEQLCYVMSLDAKSKTIICDAMVEAGDAYHLGMYNGECSGARIVNTTVRLFFASKLTNNVNTDLRFISMQNKKLLLNSQCRTAHKAGIHSFLLLDQVKDGNIVFFFKHTMI